MIQFKTKRIEDEFKLDTSIRQDLKNILYMLAIYCEVEFDEDITITELYRTQSEQDTYYAHIPNYNKKSVHQFGRGADIRSRNFNENEITKIMTFLNLITYQEGSRYQTAKYHDIGMGSHIHIQVRAGVEL